MAFRNTPNSFGSIAKSFHWLVSFLVILLLFVGYLMQEIGNTPLKGQVYNIHKLTGLTVLTLVILRLFWRWINPVPVLPPMPRWELRLEQTVKFVLYFCLFAMPLTGWIFATAAGRPPHLGHWTIAAPYITENTAIRDIFKEAHGVIAWVIIVTVCLHIAGGLKHHFINKDNVLRRMLPGSK